MDAKISAKEFAGRIRNALGSLKGTSVHDTNDDPPRTDERQVTFEGRYATWNEAIVSASGANAFPVASKDHPRASLPTSAEGWDGYLSHFEVGLLAAVMAAMANAGTQKTVVDFGGAYGHHFLTMLKVNLLPIRWEVIELKGVSEVGAQKWRHNADIRFLENLDSASKAPDLVIASGVLQYLEDPYAHIRKIEALEPSFVFLDRLPLINMDRDVCTVQRTGAQVFGVERTFPHWFISRDKLIAELSRSFDLVFRFSGFQDSGHDEFESEAIFLRRRAANQDHRARSEALLDHGQDHGRA
jgi:putative methyltransferase (TIGR04325 family)